MLDVNSGKYMKQIVLTITANLFKMEMEAQASVGHYMFKENIEAKTDTTLSKNCQRYNF